MNLEDAKAAFGAALEGLYPAFKPYRFNPKMWCCIPHCFHQDEIDALGVKPLRALEPEDLYRITLSFFSVCGELEDFKHFLPRILELTFTVRMGFVNEEMVLRQLARAGWLGWETPERHAVEDALWAWWRLAVLEDHPGLETTFSALCQTGLEPAMFLRHWRDLESTRHAVTLARFLNHAGALALVGKSPASSGGKTASAALQHFMREPATRQRFERAFLEYAGGAEARREDLEALSLAEQLVQF